MRGASYLLAAAIVLLTGLTCAHALAQPGGYDAGAYIVVEVDRPALQRQQLGNAQDQMAELLNRASVPFVREGISDNTATVRLIDTTDIPRARSALAQLDPHMSATERIGGLFDAQISDERLTELTEQAVLQTAEVLRHRIDNLGVRATVESHGRERLRIQTSEIVLPNAIRNLLIQPARFTFHLVRESRADFIAAGEAPAGTMIAPSYFADGQTELVEQHAVFTGERLIRANPTTDPLTGEFVLFFAFDAEGTRLFCEITREHAGHRFGILFDGKVLTAPRINEEICGGTGQISGNFTAEEVTALAVLLRSGALPAPIRIVDEGHD
jgi:protein-export membrane protein SecD